ncbi:MAG TPA: response regulator transcription factor, partial [Fibrella sp.]
TFLQKANDLDGCEVVFIAKNGGECLESLRGLPPGRLPHVIFMDIEMPGLDGIQTIARAHHLYPPVHFLVLTVFDDDEKIFEAIKAGASGYLLKHEPAAVLHDAIHSVLEAGGAPMSPAIARKALTMLSKTTVAPEQPSLSQSTTPAELTTREVEILKHTVSGWDAKRIAATLDLSVLTIRKHVANIYEKLHIHSKAQVIALAHEEGWFRE